MNATPATPTGRLGAVITHTVADYAAWKAAFDAHAAARREAGITAHYVNRLHEDPNTVGF